MHLNLTARQIEDWSNQEASRSLLPVLVRKLIKESLLPPTISEIDFPGYENTKRHGVDGKLTSTAFHPYVPHGKSVWECGTGEGVQEKAGRDLNTRAAEANTETTFVIVLSRNWHGVGKERWIRNNSDSGWKKIKIIDANDLEQWLESCPGTCLWLSEKIGMEQSNLETFEKFLNNWKNETEPTFPPKILLSNRDVQKNNLVNFLKNSAAGNDFVALADTRDEAIAFVCAVMEEVNLMDYPSMIVQNTQGIGEAKNWVSVSTSVPFLIAGSKDLAGKITVDLSSQCVLIVVGTRDEILERQADGKKQIILPRVINFDLIWPDNHLASRKFYKETGGSLSALHRVLNKNQIKREPVWAKVTKSDRKFIWLALLGRWDENHEADKKLISELAGLDQYREWREFLQQLITSEEPPLERTTGDSRGYRLFSRQDAFLAVASKIEGEDIDRFLEIAKTILIEGDPNYRPPDDENITPFHHARNYSNFIRSGIVDGLILLNMNKSALNCRDITNKISNFFDDIFQSEKSWHSMKDVLPGLAEASQDDFIKKLHDALHNQPEKIEDLFMPRKSFLDYNYDHPGLLWALELMAWTPEKFRKALDFLCLLQKRYENLIGNFGNKPSNSMHGVLRSWMPQTAANIEKRLEALENLYSKYPEQALELAITLSDRNDRTATYNYTPQWKDDALEVESPHNIDEDKMVRKSAAIVIKGILNDNLNMEYRIKAASRAMYNFGYWYNQDTQKAKEAILKLPNDDASPFSNLIEHTRKILVHASRSQSLEHEDADYIREIQDYFCSKDIVKANAYLFNDYLQLEKLNEEKEESVENYEDRINNARTKALQEIYERADLAGILQLTQVAEHPYTIAVRLYIDFISGKSFPLEDYLMALLKSDISANSLKEHISYIFGWIKESASGVPAAMEADEVIKIIENIREQARQSNEIKNWSDKEIILLQAIRIDQKSSRDFIDNLPNDLQERYFSQPRYNRHMECRVVNKSETGEPIYPPENEWLVNKYLHYKQPVLGWNAFPTREWIPFYLKAKLLDAMLISGKDKGEHSLSHLDNYDIERFFDDAVKQNPTNEMENRLARIEFMFSQMLDNFNQDRVSFVKRMMGREPAAFIEIVKLVYRSDDGKDDNEIKDKTIREFTVSMAFNLLYKFNLSSSNFPWISENGLDGELLAKWIEQARELAEEAKRSNSIDRVIGQSLAFSYDPDGGVQPEPEMCKVLEDIQNKRIFDGYVMGRYNGRGVITGEVDNKGFTTEGLAQAYDKAANVMREQGYRFVAGLMEALAKKYRHDAESYKAEKERRDLDWR